MPDGVNSDGDRRSAARDARNLQLWLLGIIAFAVILFLLVQASFLLISLAIAIMLFSLTADAITSIQRLGFGRVRVSVWFASIVAVALIATVLISISFVVLAQANRLAFTVVQYIDPAQRALAEMFGWMGSDVQQAVLNWLKGIQLGPWLSTLAGQAGNIASGAVLVTLLVGFMFVERLRFPAKLESLVGDTVQARRIQHILASIMRGVNLYLVVKTVVSLLTGALVFAVMSMFRLDFAFPMAVLTFVLNFIPNIGSVVATLFVSLVAYVQTSDELIGLLMLGIVSVIQFAIGQVLDPLLLGRTLRLSPFAILVSLAFWAVVWGVPGMFLAVPIMVSVMIVCSHVPGLRPVAVVLSREGLPDLDLPFGDVEPRDVALERDAPETAGGGSAQSGAEGALPGILDR